MTKLLLVYASHFGQTRAIAAKIAERLRERAIDVDLLDANQQLPIPQGYDAALFGSRVELGRHATSVVSYMRRHQDTLMRMPTAFFSVSMAASGPNPGPDPSGYLEATFEELGWKPTRSVAFAGGLPYRKYNWFLRFVMKRISKSAGHTTDTSRNHELTDWNAVATFADEVASLLPAQPVAHRSL